MICMPARRKLNIRRIDKTPARSARAIRVGDAPDSSGIVRLKRSRPDREKGATHIEYGAWLANRSLGSPDDDSDRDQRQHDMDSDGIGSGNVCICDG